MLLLWTLWHYICISKNYQLRTLKLSFFIVCVCFFQILKAQQTYDTLNTNILDEVIISATKTLRQLSTLPLPAKLISKEEIIKSNSSSLTEILDDQIGIFIVPDFGGSNGVQMQGLDSEYTLLLIDGYPLIGRQSGTLDLDRISVGNIEKIEIIKGSSSSLYGTDAIGGVINLITSEVQKDLSFNSSYKYSSFNTNDLSLNLGTIVNDNHRFNVYLNSLSSDGYDLTENDFMNTVEPYNRYTGFIRYNYTNNKWTVFSSIRGYIENQDFKLNDNIYGDNITNEFSLNTSIKYSSNDKLMVIIDNYFTNYKNDEELKSNNFNYEESFFDQSLYKAELRSIFDINEENKLIFGIGYSNESLSRNNFFDTNVSQNSTNYFIQYEGFVFENTNYIFGARFDKHNQYQSVFSPRAALRTKLNDNISIKLSFGKGFKTPDFRQLYFNFSNSTSGYSVIGFNAAKEIISNLQDLNQIANLIISEEEFNGNLKPETSLSFNIGLNYKPNNRINVDVNLFRNQIKNLIDYKIIATKINGQNIFSYYNLNKVYTLGLEVNSTFKLKDNIDFAIGYQYLEAKDNDAVNRIENGEVYARINPRSSSFRIESNDYFGLYNRSKHNINSKITISTNNNFQIYFKSKYRSRYGLMDNNGNDILDNYDQFVNPFIISDLSISKKIKNYTFTLGSDNLFDYSDPQNLPNNPGRIVYSKIIISI